MGSRRAWCVRACVVAAALALASGATAIPISVVSRPGGAAGVDRITDAASRALAHFDAWLGPYPFTTLTIVDAPWRDPRVGTSAPGEIVVASRWIAASRDRALERQVIAAVARQYWLGGAAPGPSGDWFREALVLYSAGRAIDTLLEGSHFHTDRYLGGFLPFAIRSLPLSPIAADARPRLRRFAEVDLPADASWRFATAEADGPAQCGARALYTAERYLGWPALQQALFALREQSTGQMRMADLSRVAGAQRGRSLAWLFDDACRAGATYDYAVESLSSGASAEEPGRFETRVAVRRVGDAVFAGTSDSPPSGSARSLQIEVRFADGAVVRDWWDGRLAEGELRYVSDAPAVAAAIDPDAVLVLDANRGNNTATLAAPWRPLGARLSLNWAIWLQNLMLTYTGLA